MRDYASYFIDRKMPDKRGVSIHRDIDWWMEYLAGRMAKLLFVALLAVLFLVIKLFWQVGKSPTLFPIEQVALTGDVLITQPQDVEKVLASLSEKSFFSLDIDAVSQQIEALPWVESAQVTRQWPDGLSIDLVERQAAYRWGDNELVDADGNRFAKIDQHVFQHLPKLNGADGHESEVIFAYRQLREQLGSRTDDIGIEEFVLNPYLSWELHLQNGLVVKFGRDYYQQRLNRFIDAYQQGKLPDFVQLDSIDLRYKVGFSVKWKPEFAPKQEDEALIKASFEQI